MSVLSVKFRKAKERDADTLAVLAEETFRRTFEGQNKKSDLDQYCLQNFSHDKQLEEILNPDFVTILSEVDGELIGYAQVRLYSYHRCITHEYPSELHRIYPTNTYHGLGIAHRMMSENFSVVHQAKSDCIWLSVWEHNPGAISFYRKFNFQVAGEHIFQLGSDPQRDLIMVLPSGAN